MQYQTTNVWLKQHVIVQYDEHWTTMKHYIQYEQTYLCCWLGLHYDTTAQLAEEDHLQHKPLISTIQLSASQFVVGFLSVQVSLQPIHLQLSENFTHKKYFYGTCI